MPHKYLHTITGIVLLLLSSCVKEDFSCCPTEITITYHLSEFTPQDGFSLRAAPTGPPYATTEENTIENLYLFLFPKVQGQIFKKYYLSSPISSGEGFEGTFQIQNLAGNIALSLSPERAGLRDVYLVANCDTDLKAALDAVETVDALKAVMRTNSAPWTMTTPLLMSGESLNYDFAVTPTLNEITLTRAVAKIQIDIALDNVAHRSSVISDYGYKYLNFGKNTYAIKNVGDQPNSVSQMEWQTTGISVEEVSGKVESFTLTTYINEYDDDATQTPVATVQFKFPYYPLSGMPPPEFGDDIYTIQLPTAVMRNRFYYYNVNVK